MKILNVKLEDWNWLKVIRKKFKNHEVSRMDLTRNCKMFYEIGSLFDTSQQIGVIVDVVNRKYL